MLFQTLSQPFGIPLPYVVSLSEDMTHTQDDATALSMPAMRRWNRILRVFTAEVLGLTPESPQKHRSADELVRVPFSTPVKVSADPVSVDIDIMNTTSAKLEGKQKEVNDRGT